MDKASLQPRTWKTRAEVSVLIQTSHNPGQSFHVRFCTVPETVCQGWSFMTQSLLKQGTFCPSSAKATCSTFLFTPLLQHRCLLYYCKLGGRNPCWKLTQSFVAELTFLWLRGIRQVYVAIRQCWHKGNGDSTHLRHANWILLFTGSLQLVWHSGTTTVHPSGLASTFSSKETVNCILPKLLISGHHHLTPFISAAHIMTKALMSVKENQIILVN